MEQQLEIGLYLADVADWRRFIKGRFNLIKDGISATPPPSLPEISLTERKRRLRRLTRCYIKGKGTQTLTLSVPISHSEPRMISDHGRWQSAHINALYTHFASAPFGQHLLPLLAPLYELSLPAPPELFFSQGEKILWKWLNLDSVLFSAANILKEYPERYSRLVAQAYSDIDESLWIGELLMIRGPEAVWALLPYEADHCNASN